MPCHLCFQYSDLFLGSQRSVSSLFSCRDLDREFDLVNPKFCFSLFCISWMSGFNSPAPKSCIVSSIFLTFQRALYSLESYLHISPGKRSKKGLLPSFPIWFPYFIVCLGFAEAVAQSYKSSSRLSELDPRYCQANHQLCLSRRALC